MHVFMAPKTWYFSAASARAKSMPGSISMTEGCRKLLDSVRGWMNRKSRTNVSESSSRGTISSGAVKKFGGTWSPPLVAARYLLCTLKRTSSDDLKVISASSSQTDFEESIALVYRQVVNARFIELTTGTSQVYWQRWLRSAASCRTCRGFHELLLIRSVEPNVELGSTKSPPRGRFWYETMKKAA